METSQNSSEFNQHLFEKKLSGLKDSQDSINACGHWCLQNRQHYKEIVASWLNVLKRVKIEQRLTLFYLANDVIQYSKRRNYDFVGSWGTTLQKATTLVRDEKIKNKILRIFKIWGERGIYGEEFLADLSGLINSSPTSRKGDETHEFQPTYLIQKIQTCTKLESDTDTKLKILQEHNPKIQIESETLISSLKDRAHVDDVEKELDEYSLTMENYVSAIVLEIKARVQICSLLTQAQEQLEHDKKDVKMVTHAYKTFALRVKNLKRKLEEKIPTLTSPDPSPDVNAPSPKSDDDDDDASNNASFSPKRACLDETSDPVSLFVNPGYYNPVTAPTTDSNSNYSSFLGSNLFNIQELNASAIFGSNDKTDTVTNQKVNSVSDPPPASFPLLTCPPPPPKPNIPPPPPVNYLYGAPSNPHVPLMPPPMPPFNKTNDMFSGYSDSYNGNDNGNYAMNSALPTPAYEPYEPAMPMNTFPTTTPPQTFPPTNPPLQTQSYNPYAPPVPTPTFQSPEVPLSYPPPPVKTPISNPFTSDEYNPEEDVETWDPEPAWEQPPLLETPESPPHFEKRGYTEPVEYHDSRVYENAVDIDQRVLNINDNKTLLRTKDVDHRNLISLTGSPSDSKHSWSSQGDQDYRKPVVQETHTKDQDYRMTFNIENFKLPPPPPPPNMLMNPGEMNSTHIPIIGGGTNKKVGASPKKLQDNTESIDMDLSDDDIIQKESEMNDYFDLPPPFPDFSAGEDSDANRFLDNVKNEISDFDFNDLDVMDNRTPSDFGKPGLLGPGPGYTPTNFGGPSNMMPISPQVQQHNNWMGPDFNNSEFHNQPNQLPFRGRGNMRGRFNNRGMTRPPRGNNWVGPSNFRGGRARGAQRGGMGENRGNWNNSNKGRGNWPEPRGNRGGGRCRGPFRGNFRGNFV